MAHLIEKDEVLAIIENRIRACGNSYILEELASLHRTFDSLEATEVGLLKEPVSEDLKEAAIQYAKSKHTSKVLKKIVAWDFKAGANWKEQKLMAKAVDGVAMPNDDEIWCDQKSFDLKEGDKVKVIIIKEN